MNFGRLDTSGVDLSISDSFDSPVGRLSSSLATTWIEKFEVADFPNAPPLDRLGVADFNGTIPRWRATATLAWTRGGFGVSTIGRYVAGYDDTTLNVRNGLRVESHTSLDLQASIDLSAFRGANPSWINGLVARVGVSNLLDREPPFSDVVQRGYDPSQANIRQRFWYITLTATL